MNAEDTELFETLIHPHMEGWTPVDPTLPANWDNCPHDERPPSHHAAWGIPYVVTQPLHEARAAEVYDVRRLDGGAWDRSTWIGRETTLEKACELARNLSEVTSPKGAD